MRAGSSETDLMYEILYNWHFVPEPSTKTKVSKGTYEDQERYFLKNYALETLYELDKTSYDIWNLIDGRATMAEILQQMEELYPNVHPTTTLQTILFFAESGSLRAKLEPAKRKRINFTSALRIHITIVEHSANFLKAIHRIVKPLLRRELLWVSLTFVVAAGIAFAGQFWGILGDKSNFELFGSTIVGLFIYNFVILAPVTAVHEIAHGLTVVHYGGTPKDMGTGWFYFGPMFYCDATDAWTFPRVKRMMVMLAGNLSTMLIGSAIVVVVYVLPLSGPVSNVLSMTAFWCFYTSLWNFAPPFETDGYYVLSDLLKMPNLRHDAYNYLKASLRRLLKKPVQETKDLTTKTRRILIAYAIMSVVWLAYMAYQSLTLMTYMARDAVAASLRISSAIIAPQSFSPVVFFVSFASLIYFTMMISGYGLIFFNGIKKATTRALKFETIHDRDFSISLCLPPHIPKKIATSLRQQTAKIARKFTQNFTITQEGPLTVAVLRIGGTRMALLQIKDYLQRIEQAFSSMYEGFLHQNRKEIYASSEICCPNGIKSTDLLERMSRESAKTGQRQAPNIVKQIIRDQEETGIYLLNSAVGKVWTIEMPPSQQYEAQRSLFPLFYIEDSSLTDLYDRVEDFKKRIIYGYDSLEKLATKTQTSLSQTLDHQEEYQAVAYMQPIRGRLLFIGRTEQIEGTIDKLGLLFLNQVWYGYMDNLLRDTNHMLSALSMTSLPSQEEIGEMSSGELTTLEKALSDLKSNMPFIEETVKDCKRRLQTAKSSSKEIGEILEQKANFKVGFIKPALTLNKENMKNLPKRFGDFKKHFDRLRAKISMLDAMIVEESKKKESLSRKKKMKTLWFYPLILALSAIVLLLGLKFTAGTLTYLFFGVAVAIQLVYWSAYIVSRNRARTVGRYASTPFSMAHTFVLGVVHALYRFSATGDILVPTETHSRNAKEMQTTT